MTNCGLYRFSYTPPFMSEKCVETSVTSEVTVQEMLDVISTFLVDSGYVLDGAKLVLQSNDQNFWEDDGFSMVGNPWMATMRNAPCAQDTVIAGSGLFGSDDNDQVSFKYDSPIFGSQIATFS